MIQTNQGSHFRDDVVQEFTSQTCIYNIFHEKRESSFGSKTIDTMITSQSLRKHRIDFSNNISGKYSFSWAFVWCNKNLFIEFFMCKVLFVE